MQHYHYTDITHGHNFTYYTFNNVGSVSEANRFPAFSGNILASITSTTENYTGGKWSGGSCVDYTGTAKTQTDSNNQSATETRPTNFTVKIWKRTA